MILNTWYFVKIACWWRRRRCLYIVKTWRPVSRIIFNPQRKIPSRVWPIALSRHQTFGKYHLFFNDKVLSKNFWLLMQFYSLAPINNPFKIDQQKLLTYKNWLIGANEAMVRQTMGIMYIWWRYWIHWSSRTELSTALCSANATLSNRWTSRGNYSLVFKKYILAWISLLKISNIRIEVKANKYLSVHYR